MEDVSVPDFEIHSESVSCLGIPYDIDAERLKDVLIEKVMPHDAGVSVKAIRQLKLPDGAANPRELCEGLADGEALEVMYRIGLQPDQPVSTLGFSQLRLLSIAVTLEIGGQIIIYDTCGSDPKSSKRIDEYVRSRTASKAEGAIKIVYPMVTEQKVGFVLPPRSTFLPTCSEERMRRSVQEGHRIEDMLDLI